MHHPRGVADASASAARREAELRERVLADRRRVEAKWRAKIPSVRRCANFESFKNRFGGDDAHARDHAIDVLSVGAGAGGGLGLQGQVRREQATRAKEEIARSRLSYLRAWGIGAGAAAASDGAAPQQKQQQSRRDAEERARRERRADAAAQAQAQAGQQADIERIRIQSQPVLGHLTALLGDTEETSTPRTFVRPFKALIYFQPKMKEILATLEEKWADIEELDDTSSEKTDDTPEQVEAVEEEEGTSDAEAKDEVDNNDDDHDDEVDGGDDFDDSESTFSVDSNAEDIYGIMDSVEALRDMRCYVNFVDEEVMPLYARYDGSAADRVRYDDLWALFRVGDLIYMPAAAAAETNAGRYHEVWRVYRVEVAQPEAAWPAPKGWEFFADELYAQDREDEKRFRIFAYYVDHDGSGFGAVRHVFELDFFPGERLIESLEVFPLRYRPDRERLTAALREQGRRFCSFLTDRHQTYNAWTLTRNPPFDTDGEADDEVLVDEQGAKMRHPEFVESDVIVDLAEAYQKNPDWRPVFHRLTASGGVETLAEEDDMEIQQWLGGGARHTRLFAQRELVQLLDGVEMWQRREGLAADAFLRQRCKGRRVAPAAAAAAGEDSLGGGGGGGDGLRDEDLVLLPKRMFAYALRERRFLPVNTSFLKPVHRQPGVFANLKILKDYKDIVRGLVVSHFERKELERRYVDMSTEGPSQDLIQNKGRGLVVLLHGVPGVGKTATAEAVAMEYCKPLFVITCGDLGLTPSEVEASLSNVFRLAHLWDCVLLLDEADVFLAQRSRTDMKRNALVSVFLRVLEYYSGLLFLTTNRVGTIDEAFKSRIHMSLYYPPLDKAQTRDIFRLNLAKLREIEAQRSRMTGRPPLAVREAEILDFAARHYDDNARSTGCWNGRQIRNAFQIASSLAHHGYEAEKSVASSQGQIGPAGPVLDRRLFEKVQMSTVSFDRHMADTKGFDADLPLRNTFYKEGQFE
ncbi:hypothetical protein GGR56DRAFT_662779 [Xylariaceae sp. FL0804]|nr:hypothetical protein GGR56DRAFT_662779 [Xylariaceae sp. FL0804]